MVTYGFVEAGLTRDLELARSLRTTCLEILPHWRKFPDPNPLRREVEDAGFSIHSAHGCWGGQAIDARRVDLGNTHEETRRRSVDDIRRCIDWLSDAGGRHLVVHPGGLSDFDETPRRRSILLESLASLADHASGDGLVICVENMPPGVHPGSRMKDLAELVRELNRPEVGLAIDTGHAHLVDSPASETRLSGEFLRTTHVHDNDGRQDAHLPPGLGSVDWEKWIGSLDEIGYKGPIMLECIRYIRNHPACLTPTFLDFIAELAGIS